ncbi:MAG: GntR family transcriptional regulator [Hyphomicrobiales bacterium]
MNLTKLPTVEVTTLHEKVYQVLLKSLVSGQFKPGQKLTSRTIAKELGTSDMPVRYALARFQALKALQPLANGVMQVPIMNKPHFKQLMQTRLLIETQATELAAERLNGNHMRTISFLSSELTKAAQVGDIDTYLQKNYEFKFSIYNHCGNEPLLFLIETIWMQAGPFLRNLATYSGGYLHDILEIDFHEEIVTALKKKDHKTASDAIKRDIFEGGEFLLNNVKFGGV